ncbi:hypothetical protein FBY41_1601 [Humibacillus xanthopallidus]|uniref:YjbR protein n=1 Tax=Humibacillus xanthopallidus TaxID=412689 RepID=A0A543HTJ7_9MICO|nr:hypothetical protein FBY41_1601 [Humibacillus xanthopallidus]
MARWSGATTTPSPTPAPSSSCPTPPTGRRCSPTTASSSPYLGPYGWLGLDFAPAGSVEQVAWDEVAELVDASYRLTAPARLVRLLDDGDRS